MKSMAATLAAAAAMLLLAGCSEKMATPTSPSTETTLRTGHFSGSLVAGGSRFYSLTAAQAGTISAMLASVTSPPRGVALETSLGLGIGRPAGTGCALSISTITSPALTAQLQESATAGVYCVSVHDVGNVVGSIDFVVRFSYP
jgi:hypothetical protein